MMAPLGQLSSEYISIVPAGFHNVIYGKKLPNFNLFTFKSNAESFTNVSEITNCPRIV